MTTSVLTDFHYVEQRYGLKRTHVWRLVREGVFPPGVVVRLGRNVRFNVEALERFMNAGGSM